MLDKNNDKIRKSYFMKKFEKDKLKQVVENVIENNQYKKEDTKIIIEKVFNQIQIDDIFTFQQYCDFDHSKKNIFDKQIETGQKSEVRNKEECSEKDLSENLIQSSQNKDKLKLVDYTYTNYFQQQQRKEEEQKQNHNKENNNKSQKELIQCGFKNIPQKENIQKKVIIIIANNA
ncbi:hypothetical protein PPERSA_07995 [Pseudocohnilembus persalinus]|uniref:Uncharacterized protein n=1 Tax=Pseudocohnilembus persalinus TaxID=266149 RepID=A0A0V0R2D0_PSEPJ|nr:hypothetical protein PPERSA_07995 [Pseudocohnilembus persalinus]|eukprot:KRX08684.1 hypothetical protein PPERSA_07995 [Pseudocohnilembus persalinus]